jgi:hypothetical protein
VVVLDDEIARFEDAFRQFLEEQGHAVRSGHDLVLETRRKHSSANKARDDRPAFVRPELAQVHRHDMEPAFQRRAELGTGGHDEQRRNLRELVDHPPHDIDRRRIGPMGVLDQEKYRSLLAFRANEVDQRSQGLFLRDLRRERDRAISLLKRKTEERGDIPEIVPRHAKPVDAIGLDLVESGRGLAAALERERALQRSLDRIKRAV